MAIQVRIELPSGQMLTDAYARISLCAYDRRAVGIPSVRISVDIYLNQTARQTARKPAGEAEWYEVPAFISDDSGALVTNPEYMRFSQDAQNLANVNLLNAAYNYLKTQPRFSAGMDVLED